VTAKRKRNKGLPRAAVQPRTVAKIDRQRYLVELYHRGLAYPAIYVEMISKYGITAKTVREDIRAIGAAAKKYYEDDRTIEVEAQAALGRLKQRAADPETPPNVATRCDELVLNMLGMRSVRTLQKSLTAQAIKLKGAQAELATTRSKLAELQLGRLQRVTRDAVELSDEVRDTMREIRDRRSVTFGDIVKLTTFAFDRQINDPDSRDAMQSLRLFLQIAMTDPAGSNLSQQLFQLPEGLPLFAPEEDDPGDELMT